MMQIWEGETGGPKDCLYRSNSRSARLRKDDSKLGDSFLPLTTKSVLQQQNDDRISYLQWLYANTAKQAILAGSVPRAIVAGNARSFEGHGAKLTNL